ncbi:MAG: LLM class flavin-dependent oxidoreductase [Sphingobacteriia bacterium]|nr:LLM class flavin-dependent oxidoreductase [Sphingobacteriia bacterium]
MQFSLFFFSSLFSYNESQKYNLVIEATKFADKNNFKAVWLPERHFNDFGGLFPNPALIGAALSTLTTEIQIRAGSVVLPLNNPILIAEQWACLDNLTNGRIGLSAAAGWHPDDFILNPENYPKRYEILYQNIELIQKLWEDQKVDAYNGNNKLIQFSIFPKPIQKKLPLWLTAAGSIENFEKAGRIGCNILTHLLNHDINQLKDKIELYHKVCKENNFKGHVTLMLHTYLGENSDVIRDLAYKPLIKYLKNSMELEKRAKGIDELIDNDDEEILLDFAFEKYFENGLFGTVENCKFYVNQLKKIGIDEIACLIDFGLEDKKIMSGLKYLSDLNNIFLS